MSTRNILVTGATGKQGGAVIQAILAHPPPFAYKILALTRNTASPGAKALADNPNIDLLPGSLSDPAAIFEQAGGSGAIWGVFLMTLPEMGKKDAIEREEKQGRGLVDAAIANDVKHFVFSSVDRGGDASDTSPTNIPHFISKHNIEQYLKEKAQGAQMTWTILRPVAFMENMTADFIGRVFAAMWSNLGEKKLQLVATKDIGVFAAQAFANADADEYKNQAIGLAGADLTQAEANGVFWDAMGRPMPRSYGFMGSLVQKMVPELGVMFQWFMDTGYGVDIDRCKKLNPGMLDFGAWLNEESSFKR